MRNRKTVASALFTGLLIGLSTVTASSQILGTGAGRITGPVLGPVTGPVMQTGGRTGILYGPDIDPSSRNMGGRQAGHPDQATVQNESASPQRSYRSIPGIVNNVGDRAGRTYSTAGSGSASTNGASAASYGSASANAKSRTLSGNSSSSANTRNASANAGGVLNVALSKNRSIRSIADERITAARTRLANTKQNVAGFGAANHARVSALRSNVTDRASNRINATRGAVSDRVGTARGIAASKVTTARSRVNAAKNRVSDRYYDVRDYAGNVKSSSVSRAHNTAGYARARVRHAVNRARHLATKARKARVSATVRSH